MNPIPMSVAQADAFTDALFQFIESKTTGRPIVTAVEQMLDSTIKAAMPAFLAYAASKGIVTVTT